MANRETQLRRIIEELFELAAPGYLKTSLWKAYQVILSESGQKATRTEMNKGILEPIEPHIQQVLTDIARTYQEDRKEAKGYENTERAICEALFPIVIPGSVKNSLWTAYQATKSNQTRAEREYHLMRDSSGLEQQTDDQRALDLYLLAEKHFYEGPENSPDDATLLQTMALALLTRQLYRFNEQRDTLSEDIAMLRETTDTAIKHLAGHVSHLALQLRVNQTPESE